MKTKVQKWGNSLAVRIPQSFAEEVGFQNGTSVTLSMDDGKLVLTPVSSSSIKLECLLEQITEANLYSEIETGQPSGNEVW